MQTAETNLHNAGCVADDLHKKIQERFLVVAKVGKAAGAVLKAGDLPKAKELLGAAVRMMNDPDINATTPLIVQTLKGQQ
jgi:hypothetical protein